MSYYKVELEYFLDSVCPTVSCEEVKNFKCKLPWWGLYLISYRD